MAIEILTPAQVREHLCYDKDTGIFTWKVRKQGRKLGVPLGAKNSNGYLLIVVCRKHYAAHRLAWMHFHGEIPDGMQIDHINGVRDDNRIDNLRVVTPSQNNLNRGVAHTKPRFTDFDALNN